MIDELNTRHGLQDHISFSAGPNQMPVAVIENRHATAEVHLHGAQVTSFQPRSRRPVLWMSEEAIFNPPKPIRGGIPICWPWFGTPAEHPERAQHGFARNRQWRVIDTTAGDDGETILTLGLENDAETLAAWPHAFSLLCRICVGSSLAVELTYRNEGTQPAMVETALHTYFSVGDSSRIRITGLDGRVYHDQLDGMRVRHQSGPITIGAEVDRIYVDTEDECLIHDDVWHRIIRIGKTGSRSTVVWNPWVEKSKRILDFPNEGYKGMVCIETTNAAGDQRTIEPGASHSLGQTVSVEGNQPTSS